MRGKILVLLVCIAMLVGVLSGCTETKVEANKLPKASFTYEPTTGIYVGTGINFTDTSTDADGTIVSWNWTFGDEAIFAEQNPLMHTYDTVGTYNVTLIVTDNDGTDSTPYSKFITVEFKPPNADFSYSPSVNITNATTILFTDISIPGDAAINNWTWDFGDEGDMVYTQNATYMYTAIGNYTVTLTVTDENGKEDTKTAVEIEVIKAS